MKETEKVKVQAVFMQYSSSTSNVHKISYFQSAHVSAKP